MMTNTASNSSASNSIHRNVVPSEVGWQFLSQYYTYVNKEPDRLYCFYNKKSTFLHGTEGEDEKPCHGQQEIHAKISSLGFQDCKVFIHSVDAQASADGGIVIQLIGEMANHGEEWRKFVQTVFLAEQPNGYFVLNDIFRFLKEEIIDSDEPEVEPEAIPAPVAEPPTESVPVSAAPAPVPEPFHEPSPSPAPPTTFIVAPAPVPEPVQIEEPTTVAELPEPEPYVAPEPPAESQPPSRPNGIAPHTQDIVEKQVPTPAPAAPAAPQPPATPVEKSRSPAPPAPSTPAAPTPPPVAPVAAAPAHSHTQTQAPRAPKTWANLAAANSKKWGSAVAQESRGTTEVVPPSPSTPNSGQVTPGGPASAGPAQQGGRSAHPALVQAQTITTAQCFIKGVTENITQQALTSVLTTRFGPLKELEIVRSKVCAFGEFTTIEAARKAIIASLHVAQGGEGGIFIDLPDGDRARIVVDTKKERSERPAPRPRGGAPGQGQGAGTGDGNVNSGGRGGGTQGNTGGSGFRGGRGRGRGGPPGGK